MTTRRLFFSLGLFISLVIQQKASAAVQVTVHPARAPLTLTQAQQFTATVAGTTNTAVNWFVDGVRGGNSTVGTISSTGLYHPPAVKGIHTITARSAVSTAFANATVWITNYPGVPLSTHVPHRRLSGRCRPEARSVAPTCSQPQVQDAASTSLRQLAPRTDRYLLVALHPLS